MIQVTVKLKGWDDKRLRKCAEFREDGYQYAYVDEGLEVEKLMELARVLRENLWDREIEKVRIDIELAADCGCIQHIDEPPPPVKEDDNDQTQKETQRD